MAQRDIDYVAKDFDSIVDALITFATVNFGPDTEANRQWTSFNVDDFSRTWLELVAYIGDLIFFYLDMQATQSNLQTATIRSSVLNIAKQFGFSVATASSASGLAQFTLSTSGTIPTGFRLSAENGQEFFVSSNSPAPGSSSLVQLLSVIQGIQRSENFSAKGVQNEEIVLSFTPIVVDTVNPISSLVSPLVTVNGNTYTLVDTFIRSTPTDQHFRLLSNAEGQSIIRFGDGIFATQLNPNDSVVINYRTGGGAAGNIPADTLTTATDSSTILESVTNPDAFTGGAEEATIEQLRELIPAHLRTLERAVTVNDYGDIIIANFNSISKATAEKNITDVGVDIDVYVVPAGNSITPITSNVSLFTSVSDFIDERKTVTTTFRVLDAFGVDINTKIRAHLSSGASRSLVSSNMQSALTGFFDLNSGDVDETGTKFGQNILLNDVFALIDGVEGIDRFDILELNYKPRMVEAVAPGTNYLVSEIETYPNIAASEWLIGPDESTTSPEYIPYTVFKRIVGTLSNLGEDNLTDDNLNLSIVESTASGVNVEGTDNIIFDMSRTFLVDEFVGGISTITLSGPTGDTYGHTGSTFSPRIGDRIVQGANTAWVREVVDSTNFVLSSAYPSGISAGAAQIKRDRYLLVDSASNVWTIEDNDAHTLVLSSIAVNSTSTSDVVGGEYKIVTSLIGKNLLFHDLIFAGIEYNTHNAFYRSNSSFNLVGTIGDAFAISIPQESKGNFGVPLTLDTWNSDTPTPGYGVVHCAGNPDLSSITVGQSSAYTLIDTDLNVYEVVAVNNLSKEITILHDSTITPAPRVDDAVGNPASIAPRYYSDDEEVSFVLGLAHRPTGVGFQAVGNIAFASPEIATVDRASNVVTVVTATEHPYEVGQNVEILNVTDGSFDGLFDIVSVPDANTFTYAQVAGDASSTGGQASFTGMNITDGTLLKLNDGTNPETVFEFDKGGGTSGSNVPITFTDTSNAEDLKDAVIAAVGSVGTSLGISPSDGTGIFGTDEVVFLQNDNLGIIGNETIPPTIAIAGITIAGMAGGIGSGHGIPTPVIPAPGENVNDFGISSDGTILDHFEFRTSGFVDDIVNLRNSEIPQISTDNIELDLRGGVT